jgi:hypothetical protein
MCWTTVGDRCVYTFPDNLIYNDNSKWDFDKIELSGQTGITPAQLPEVHALLAVTTSFSVVS